MKRILLVFIAAVLLSVVCTSAASAHDQGWSAVTNNEERLYYTDGSKYNIASNISYLGTWDCAYSYNGQSCPGVRLFPLASGQLLSLRNVRVTDYCSSSDGALGWTVPESYVAPGQWKVNIKLDRCDLDAHTDPAQDALHQRKTINHEFLHAMGFAHTPQDAYYNANSIMCPRCWGQNHTGRPGVHDWYDYWDKWVGHAVGPSP